MTFKKVDGLLIDWDWAEGEFRMPQRLTKETPLYKIDILSDWINEINLEYRKVIGEHFLYLSSNHSNPDISLQKKLENFQKVIEECYSGPIPVDLKDICIEALLKCEPSTKFSE